jgi:hypothetical protein
MTDDQTPAPGHGQIMVAAAAEHTPCHARGHARLGVLAEVVVTFGDRGTRWQRDALWQDCCGRSYAMCGESWAATRQVAQNARPGLPITDTAPATRTPAPQAACPAP